MKNIECITKNKSYNIAIDTYKVILGQEFEDKFNVYKCIKNHFNKINLSEYGKENGNKFNVKLNDRYIDIKDTLFFEIGYDYDYNTDSKLTTKSLILKYLECILDDIEYDDSFNTIKELLYSFVNIELEDKLNIEFDDFVLNVTSDEFNYKTLIKLIMPCILKEGLEVNNNDLDYENLIILQLKLINKIAERIQKQILVLANIPYLTKRIVNELNLLKCNLCIIVFSNNYINDINIENVILSDLSWLDLGNDENVHEFLFKSPFTNSIEAFKSKIKESLNNYSIYKIIYNKR